MTSIQNIQSGQISYLYSQLANIPPPTSSDLADVLLNGNSAGASDIDMNNNDILDVNNIDLVTINGSAYPPVVVADALSDVLLIGNNAGTTDIDMNTNDILLVNNIDLVTINGSAYPPVVVAQDLTSVLTVGNNAGTTNIDMNNNDILLVNNIDLVTINGSSYPPAVLVDTLQQVLDLGNTANGVNATIGLTNSGVGYTSNPQLTLNNSNATAGTTTGVPSIEYSKSGRNGIATDLIASQHFYAKNFAGVKTEFAKIESSIRNTALGNDDGAIGMFATLNGVLSEFFRFNGADGENNSFYPIDMNNQAIKTSTGNLNISATSSTGTGQIIITPKSSSNVNINGDLLMTTDKTITLNDISPIVVQTLLGNGAVSINDATNSNNALLVPSSLTFSTGAPSATTYSPSGFFNNDNSIKCNSTDGFVLNYASPTNFTELNLSKLELYNSTPASNLIDQIVLQNTGAGNPGIGIQSTDNTPGILTPILKNSGFTNQSLGFSYTDTGAPPGVNTNLQLMNTTGGSGTLSYTNTIDASPLLITSNNSIQLQTSQDLVLGGASIQSNSASGNSGEHLRILLNGVYYKIKLEND